MPTTVLLQIGSDSLCGERVPFPASPVRRGDRCAPAPSPGYLLGASSVLPRLDAAPCPWPRFRHIQNPKSWWGFLAHLPASCASDSTGALHLMKLCSVRVFAGQGTSVTTWGVWDTGIKESSCGCHALNPWLFALMLIFLGLFW